MASVGGAAPIINCTVRVAVWGIGGVASLTVNVKERLLVLVEMPLMTPVDGFSDNPFGRAGDPTASPQV